MARNLPEGTLLQATLAAKYEVHLMRLKAESPKEYQQLKDEVGEGDELNRLIHEKRHWQLPTTLLARLVNQGAVDKKMLVGPDSWFKTQEAHRPQQTEAGEAPLSPLQRHFGMIGGE